MKYIEFDVRRLIADYHQNKRTLADEITDFINFLGQEYAIEDIQYKVVNEPRLSGDELIYVPYFTAFVRYRLIEH